MGCNCKNGDKEAVDLTTSMDMGRKIIFYGLKIIGFLLFLMLLPIINIIMIWVIFNTMIFNKGIDLKPLLTRIGDKLANKDDDDYEYDELTDDNYELVDVEDITEKK